MKTSTRLTAAFGLLSALLVLCIAAALTTMSRMNAAATEVSQIRLLSVQTVNLIDRQTREIRNLELAHVLNTDAKQFPVIEQQLKGRFDRMAQLGRDYEKLISSADERAAYDQFVAQAKEYRGLHNEVLVLSLRFAKNEAKALLEGDSRTLVTSYLAKLEDLLRINAKGADDAAAASVAAYDLAKVLVLATGAAGLCLAIIAGVLVTRSVTRPIEQAVRTLGRLAEGDLTEDVAVDRRDEFGALQHALHQTVTSLRHVVGEVRAGVASVAAASGQIANGNADLSQRTEEQASNLQQTAASMEELSSTVKAGAETAGQADLLSSQASAAATRGGEMMNHVVGTMNEISCASRKIADIIAVIDGIAFQTNLLALNAAVEAARAGEQGRGFAVVASEVRNLASRSADAAKEIKALIGANLAKVESGARQVNEAGSSMSEIVGQVRRVSQMIAELSNAAVEQSQGISQVGEAVHQLDQVTQQNAALVEQSAAAAESMRLQATRLTDAVGVFRLS